MFLLESVFWNVQVDLKGGRSFQPECREGILKGILESVCHMGQDSQPAWSLCCYILTPPLCCKVGVAYTITAHSSYLPCTLKLMHAIAVACCCGSASYTSDYYTYITFWRVHVCLSWYVYKDFSGRQLKKCCALGRGNTFWRSLPHLYGSACISNCCFCAFRVKLTTYHCCK